MFFFLICGVLGLFNFLTALFVFLMAETKSEVVMCLFFVGVGILLTLIALVSALTDPYVQEELCGNESVQQQQQTQSTRRVGPEEIEMEEVAL